MGYNPTQDSTAKGKSNDELCDGRCSGGPGLIPTCLIHATGDNTPWQSPAFRLKLAA
jgi:hypothetical protein